MKTDIKRQWVEALRSGDYQQGKEYLRKDDKFCCLGVLCDLAVKAGVVTEAPGVNGSTLYGVEGDRDSEVLPRAVMDWAGLDDRVPSVVTSLHDDDPDDDPEAVSIEVAELNDSFCYDFEALAELIEAQL